LSAGERVILGLTLAFAAAFLAVSFAAVLNDLARYCRGGRNRRRAFTRPADERGTWLRRVPGACLGWFKETNARQRREKGGRR